MTIGAISAIISSAVIGLSAITTIFSVWWTRRKRRWEKKIAFYKKEIDKSNNQIIEYKKEMENTSYNSKIQQKINRVQKENDSYVSKIEKFKLKIAK